MPAVNAPSRSEERLPMLPSDEVHTPRNQSVGFKAMEVAGDIAHSRECPEINHNYRVANSKAQKYMRSLWVARPLAVAAHDSDLLRLYSLARVLHLERDIFDQEGPDFVAETVGVEMSLQRYQHITLRHQPSRESSTLNVKRAFTFSANTSVMLRSKFAKIFIANWGSIRRSLIRSSRVSVSAMPMLECTH